MVYLRQSRYRNCGLRRTLDGNIPHFCFTKNGTLYFAISFTYLGTLHDFFFDTKYKIELYLACFFILCYSDAIPFYIYILISVRLHSLYNAFFSVSYRPEKINIMTATTEIHRSMGNSFPSLQHAAALVGCFLTHRQAVYK